MKRAITLLTIILGMNFVQLYANNVQITNVTLVDPTHLSFNISWDNSWRVATPPSNHDAVWIFVKRALCPDPLVWLHTFVNPTGHTVGVPLEVYVDSYNPSDSTAGLFLRRSGLGYGNIDNVQVTVELEPIVPAGEYEFKVFAIEMVYIPQGGFYVGDGSTTITSNSFNRFHQGNNPNMPYYIGSEAQISVGTTSSDQIYAAGYPPSSTIPAQYPKGYNAIYCMKYEITQGQIADFFNYVPKQFSDVYFMDNNGIGNSSYEANGQVWLSIAWPNITSKYPWRPPFGYWGDNMAKCNIFWLTYLDWIGLRPMTTLEFEKICRGLSARVPNEFAWGTTLILFWSSNNSYQASVHDTLYYGNSAETHQATLPAGTGIVNAQATTGTPRVYRVGFAAKTTTNRISAGATYYGVMDMSGSCYEGVIDVNNASELLFRAVPGNGCLSSNYEFNVPSWPRNTWGTSFTIFRGGGVGDNDYRKMTISTRFINAGNQGSTYNYRGVR